MLTRPTTTLTHHPDAQRNAYLCVASLRYCAQEANPSLIRVVEQGGLPPDINAYTWLLTALRACEMWEDVRSVFSFLCVSENIYRTNQPKASSPP